MKNRSHFVSTELFEREFEKKVKIRQGGIYSDIRIVTKGLVKAGARSNRSKGRLLERG